MKKLLPLLLLPLVITLTQAAQAQQMQIRFTYNTISTIGKGAQSRPSFQLNGGWVYTPNACPQSNCYGVMEFSDEPGNAYYTWLFLAAGEEEIGATGTYTCTRSITSNEIVYWPAGWPAETLSQVGQLGGLFDLGLNNLNHPQYEAAIQVAIFWFIWGKPDITTRHVSDTVLTEAQNYYNMAVSGSLVDDRYAVWFCQASDMPTLVGLPSAPLATHQAVR